MHMYASKSASVWIVCVRVSRLMSFLLQASSAGTLAACTYECNVCISSFLYFISCLRFFLLLFFIHFSYLSLCSAVRSVYARFNITLIYRSPLKAWMRFKLVRSIVRLCVCSLFWTLLDVRTCMCECMFACECVGVRVCTFHFNKYTNIFIHQFQLLPHTHRTIENVKCVLHISSSTKPTIESVNLRNFELLCKWHCTHQGLNDMK